MDWMTAAWIGWGTSFLVLEGLALWRGNRGKPKKDSRTLSGHVWRLFRVFHDHAAVRWTGRIIILGFGVWLTLHMMFGVFGGPGEISW